MTPNNNNISLMNSFGFICY